MPYDALYYPWIDPPQRAILTTAMLYWDHLYTIAPAEHDPYESEHSRTARELGFLRPRRVHSQSDEVITAGNEFLKDVDRLAIQADAKLARKEGPKNLNHTRLHTEKMSHSLRRALVGRRRPDKSGFFSADRSLAFAYMARLAAVLARSDHFSPYTDWTSGHNIVVDRYAAPSHGPALNSAEATLAALSFSTLRILPHTPLGQIWAFRETHHAELGRYRRSIRKLARIVQPSISHDEMRQQCNSLLKDEIVPATGEVGAKLKENGIDFAAAALEAAMLGAWTWVATKDAKAGFIAAAGTITLKFGFSECKRRIAKARILRSPFAYLAHAQAHFAEEAVQ